MINSKKKVWIFTFEYAGVAKAGGLGEVPANQAKELANDFDITVFMPSHGKLESLMEKYQVVKLPYSCTGHMDPEIFGIGESDFDYEISFYQLIINEVRIIILAGGNPATKKILEDKIIYNPDTIKSKILLYSTGLRGFVKYLIKKESEFLPEIVHLHDYHVVIAFIGVKQELKKQELVPLSILTIHLLTWPRFQEEFYTKCGIDYTAIDVLLPEGRKLISFREIYSLGKENVSQNQIPTVEVIGALVSDVVTTVSESYLNSDIIPNCGGDLIEFKTDFLWDGCDWDYYDILKDVVKSHGEHLRDVLGIEEESQITRDNLKNYLLTYKIGQLDRSPLINSDKILSTINEISNGSPFIKNGTLKAFNESGPLLITTGRISPQKGFETIFSGVPDIIQAIPNAKILFLILPTDYSLDEIKKYAQFVKKYPNNIRIVFGVASDIFYLAHVAADAYCALSRWEPFGIMALEAMASKLPIIASKVGGLQETIIDINKDYERGTGILIGKDQPKEFAEAAISILKAAEVASYVNNGKIKEEEKLTNIIDQIPNEIVRIQVSVNPLYYDKIRENCYLRVRNNFTWNIVSEKLKLIYLTQQTN